VNTGEGGKKRRGRGQGGGWGKEGVTAFDLVAFFLITFFLIAFRGKKGVTAIFTPHT